MWAWIVFTPVGVAALTPITASQCTWSSDSETSWTSRTALHWSLLRNRAYFFFFISCCISSYLLSGHVNIHCTNIMKSSGWGSKASVVGQIITRVKKGLDFESGHPKDRWGPWYIPTQNVTSRHLKKLKLKSCNKKCCSHISVHMCTP